MMGAGRILRFRGLMLLVLLAGCQWAGPKDRSQDIATASALQGPAVEVTALPPVAEQASAQDLAPTAAPDQPLAPATAPIATAPSETPVVAEVKSAAQLACEKKGGSFVGLGKGGIKTCQMPTRDGGKQCRRESDCDGVCLARSGTCAPVKPIFGCQSILQDDGRQVDLCID